MGRGSRFDLALPNPLMALVRDCETICVAGCCGLDAFDRDAKHMLPWLREHQDEFFLVLDQLSDALRAVGGHRGPVHSGQDEFNAVWRKPGDCLQFLRQWRETILAGAKVVYGKLPSIDAGWRTADVVALARGIHADCAFGRLPVLADALQEAGCDDEDVLAHCRDASAEHRRGCWVIDLILGEG